MIISYLLRKARGQYFIFIAIYEPAKQNYPAPARKTNIKSWSKSKRQPTDPASETALIKT